ncbi:hypothetical protein EJB05_53331, partial [Eragrostis curvula]
MGLNSPQTFSTSSSSCLLSVPKVPIQTSNSFHIPIQTSGRSKGKSIDEPPFRPHPPLIRSTPSIQWRPLAVEAQKYISSLSFPPLSEEERRLNAPVVITCNEQRREVSVVQNIANKQIDHTFLFDKVLGPKSRQHDVFNHAVVPLVNEGLEEEVVSSADEIYRILEKGSAKRKTAETLLNKQSSRSHSIFSITIHIKECTLEGKEMIKSGKLNLVDLAGSENVSRAELAKREKSTRVFLHLGMSLILLLSTLDTYHTGKTKTCIIATIAPSVHCLEETLSTLDYAHRAKHIKNKPEVNQKMMKSALIKDLYIEMDHLKQELYAAREKNGVYIPREQYVADEAEKKEAEEGPAPAQPQHRRRRRRRGRGRGRRGAKAGDAAEDESAPPSERSSPPPVRELAPAGWQDALDACYIERTEDIDQWEAELEYRAVFVTVLGTRPPVTQEEAVSAIAARFNLEEQRMEIFPSAPEDFVLLLPDHDAYQLVLQGDRTVTTPAFTLGLRQWHRVAHAEQGALYHKMHIELTGIPMHVWNYTTASDLLRPFCSIESVDPETAARRDRFKFGVVAWTTRPEFIPAARTLVVPEPNHFDGPYEPNRRTLKYKVQIQVRRLLTRFPPEAPPTPPTSSPPSSASDHSSDDDSPARHPKRRRRVRGRSRRGRASNSGAATPPPLEDAVDGLAVESLAAVTPSDLRPPSGDSTPALKTVGPHKAAQLPEVNGLSGAVGEEAGWKFAGIQECSPDLHARLLDSRAAQSREGSMERDPMLQEFLNYYSGCPSPLPPRAPDCSINAGLTVSQELAQAHELGQSVGSLDLQPVNPIEDDMQAGPDNLALEEDHEQAHFGPNHDMQPEADLNLPSPPPARQAGDIDVAQVFLDSVRCPYADNTRLVTTPPPRPRKKRQQAPTTLRRSRRIAAAGYTGTTLQRAQEGLMRKMGIQLDEVNGLYESQKVLSANLKKVLVDEAQKLQSELENTAGDLSGLFSKLERKGNIEDANKSIVQQFHSKLTEDMNLLHRTVSTSVSKQESQLKSLEEGMQSFVSSKGKVTGELKEHVRKLKETFNSRIAQLHGLAKELELKSQLSFEKINSQVITHTSDLDDCMKGLLVDVDQSLSELQNGLSRQELNLAKFIEQQHEVFAADEERYLMEKIAGLLAESNARKKNMSKTSAESCSEQWRMAQNSVLALGRSNAESICSAISNGNEVNNKLHTRFSSAVAAGVEDNDVSSKSLLYSIDDSLKLDHGICENVKSTVTSSKVELHELQRGHQEKTKGISGNADRSLGDDYKVDEPTCSTPRRREFNIPSKPIGDLVTPPLEDLVKSFWDSRTPTILAKGNGKHTLENQRAPLATIN